LRQFTGGNGTAYYFIRVVVAGGGAFGQVRAALPVNYTTLRAYADCSSGKGSAGAASYTALPVIQDLPFINKFRIRTPDAAQITANTEDSAPYAGAVPC